MRLSAIVALASTFFVVSMATYTMTSRPEEETWEFGTNPPQSVIEAPIDDTVRDVPDISDIVQPSVVEVKEDDAVVAKKVEELSYIKEPTDIANNPLDDFLSKLSPLDRLQYETVKRYESAGMELTSGMRYDIYKVLRGWGYDRNLNKIEFSSDIAETAIDFYVNNYHLLQSSSFGESEFENLWMIFGSRGDGIPNIDPERFEGDNGAFFYDLAETEALWPSELQRIFGNDSDGISIISDDNLDKFQDFLYNGDFEMAYERATHMGDISQSEFLVQASILFQDKYNLEDEVVESIVMDYQISPENYSVYANANGSHENGTQLVSYVRKDDYISFCLEEMDPRQQTADMLIVPFGQYDNNTDRVPDSNFETLRSYLPTVVSDRVMEEMIRIYGQNRMGEVHFTPEQISQQHVDLSIN